MSVASPSGSRQGKLEVLKAAARQRTAAGQMDSPWAWSRRAAADYLLPDGHLVRALEQAYRVLVLEGRGDTHRALDAIISNSRGAH
jgi:hypothetical protein